MQNYILPILLAVFGASGFWQIILYLIEKARKKNSTEDEALLGLLHNEIYILCKRYILRGYVMVEELNNLEYLYNPYIELGGNGTAKRLMEEVYKLPLKETKHETD